MNPFSLDHKRDIPRNCAHCGKLFFVTNRFHSARFCDHNGIASFCPVYHQKKSAWDYATLTGKPLPEPVKYVTI